MVAGPWRPGVLVATPVGQRSWGLVNVILFKLLEGRDSDFFFTAIPQRLPWNTVSAK